MIVDPIENYLREHYFETLKLRQYEVELAAATRAYDESVSLYHGHGFDAVRTKNKKISKPVEAAAVLLDSLGARVHEISHKIIGCRAVIAEIETLVCILDGRERMYVQLRYFENRTPANTLMKMQQAIKISESTCGKVRTAALDKLRAPFEATYARRRQIAGEERNEAQNAVATN